MTSQERDGILNHQKLDHIFNSFSGPHKETINHMIMVVPINERYNAIGPFY